MITIYALISTLAGIVGFSYLTNPFSRWSIVRRHYRAEMTARTLTIIDENNRLRVNNRWYMRWLAIFNNGIYIIWSRLHKRPTSTAADVQSIINDIYDLRFDTNHLLLTSGDHFSSLFVRNLGVFYYPTLDTQLPTTEDKWQRRQICYLQTLAYALGVFAKTDALTTTIVPTGRSQATCVNFHSYPSDTLYGILYALAALLGKEPARPYEYTNVNQVSSDTHDAAAKLIETYSDSLTRHYQTYRQTVFDETTGLIRHDIRMSGAKDITMRENAFYDNVVFWKTTQLAMKLGLVPHDATFLRKLRAHIIDSFWDDTAGHFLEDLSEEGKAKKYYSSDWLIVLATGFLSPIKKSERQYFVRSVAYIQKHKIDQPFAIKYQQDTRAHRQFPIVRFAVASYGGDSIWSFWGMEYIKVLLALYRATSEPSYLETANYHIDSYQKNMLRYGGYPEVYDAKGDLLETPLYRSIIQTGWVVGFEQVLAIRASFTDA